MEEKEFASAPAADDALVAGRANVIARAYSYVRMSTAKQAHGDSHRRQTEASERWVRAHPGVVLDRELSLYDKGVSAFTGKNVEVGALGRFLALIREGEIPSGSFLLVESLDRLSRDRVTAALQVFLEMIENGISVVTLADGYVFKAGETELHQLMASIISMGRAHEESYVKSVRGLARWENKRNLISSEKMTARGPGWVILADSRDIFVPIPERAQVVGRVFRMSANGHGSYSITRTLNKEGVPPFGRSNGWTESYVKKILANRAVLGEFQPHRKEGGKRVPIGPVVQDYFPRIVDDELFLLAQASRRRRARDGAGRKGLRLANLFSQLATCEYCGAPMHMINKGRGPKGGRYLRCSAAVRGLSCASGGWRYSDFEKSFLFFSREIDLRGVTDSVGKHAHLEAARQRADAARERLHVGNLLRDRTYQLLSAGKVDLNWLQEKLVECEREIAAAAQALDEAEAAQREAVVPTVSDPSELLSLISALQADTDEVTVGQRVKLAARLKEVVLILRLAADGDKPKLKLTERFLEQHEPDGGYRKAVMGAMRQADKKQGGQSFSVTFAGGTSRKVIVSADDPTKYVAEVTYEANSHAGTLSRDGLEPLLLAPQTFSQGPLNEPAATV